MNERLAPEMIRNYSVGIAALWNKVKETWGWVFSRMPSPDPMKSAEYDPASEEMVNEETDYLGNLPPLVALQFWLLIIILRSYNRGVKCCAVSHWTSSRPFNLIIRWRLEALVIDCRMEYIATIWWDEEYCYEVEEKNDEESGQLYAVKPFSLL